MAIAKKAKADYSFQDDAIKKIVLDFKTEPTSKNLLVIPTGGGKTLTAIRAVNRMIEEGFLTDKDRVLWAVHRKQLSQQTKGVLFEKKNVEMFGFLPALKKVLEVEMIASSRKVLRADKKNKYKILIIDEAHHSAANGYKEFFSKKIGILGLTATPTRNDDSVLDFDKISYSITFKELIDLNVILKPEFLKAQTGSTIDIKSLDLDARNKDQLNKGFNTDTRNRFIAEKIFEYKNIFKKVIVFAGTNEHAKDLYEIIRQKNKFYGDPYSHVGYIFGDNENEKEIENEKYLKWHQTLSSSVLVNCQMLNEGYDDPSINAVVMVVPTRSVLYYMQCVGRVVRRPEEGEGKAYVLEFDDKLPNISYRIDNKWLFSDISDFLEPVVTEEACNDNKDYQARVVKLFKTHNISDKYVRMIPHPENFEDVSLMLLQPKAEVDSKSKWLPLFFEPENRKKYTIIFSTIANNIAKFGGKNDKFVIHDLLKVPEDDMYFSDRAYRTDFIETLNKAFAEVSRKSKVQRIKYINFVTKLDIPSEFVEFISDCHNAAFLQEQYNNILESGVADYLIKFPLILGGYEGYYCTKEMFDFCKEYLKILNDIKNKTKVEERDGAIYNIQNLLEHVPLPPRYLQSLTLIVRDNLTPYYYEIIK